MTDLAVKLKNERILTDDELRVLLSGEYDGRLMEEADKVRKSVFGDKVYIRGLIEISSICKNDCYYCGIRASNNNAVRYRLTEEDIISCCELGRELGFSTFVLQGGEDGYFTDERLCDIIKGIKRTVPGCAVTLSLGERSAESYKLLKEAGADRYLLRHEAADEDLYKRLHPEGMKLQNRKKCLFELKAAGFQVGSGFMVGAPYQTVDNIISDIRFLTELEPAMIGIGPFVPHCDTCFKDSKHGSVAMTLRLISILRLIFPNALIPATTALGTVEEGGREKGIMCGANVVMPNLSPESARKSYNLYNNKLATGAESVEGLKELERKIKGAGYSMSMERGDAPGFEI